MSKYKIELKQIVDYPRCVYTDNLSSNWLQTGAFARTEAPVFLFVNEPPVLLGVLKA